MLFTNTENNFNKLHIHPSKGHIFYSDGSKSENADKRIYCSDFFSDGLTFPQGNYVSVIQSDIFGIMNCASALLPLLDMQEPIIYTDSQSALKISWLPYIL